MVKVEKNLFFIYLKNSYRLGTRKSYRMCSACKRMYLSCIPLYSKDKKEKRSINTFRIFLNTANKIGENGSKHVFHISQREASILG